MEELATDDLFHLITAVGHCPELWRVDILEYGNQIIKDLAWRRISESLNVPVDLCQMRWKSLWDMYRRERTKDKGQRSGSAAGTMTRWRYASALSYLDPYMSSRPTTCNMGSRVEVGADVPATGVKEESATGLEGVLKVESPEPGTSCAEDDLTSPAAPSSTRLTAETRTGPSRRRTRKRTREEDPPVSDFERELLATLKLRQLRSTLPKMSDNEIFIYSLAPLLKRLPSQKEGAIKCKIYMLLYEAIIGSSEVAV